MMINRTVLEDRHISPSLIVKWNYVMSDIESCRQFVLRLLSKKARLPEPLPAGFDYMCSGHVDSMGLIKFIVEVETEFGIEIGEADLLDPAFKTVEGLINCVDSKRSLT